MIQAAVVGKAPSLELRRRSTERVLKSYVFDLVHVELPLRVIVDSHDGITVIIEDPAVADLLEHFALPIRVVESIEDPEVRFLEG